VSISLEDLDCAEVDLGLDEYLSGSTGERPDQHESVVMAEAEDTPSRRNLGRSFENRG
jgi:hypothetical protein